MKGRDLRAHPRRRERVNDNEPQAVGDRDLTPTDAATLRTIQLLLAGKIQLREQVQPAKPRKDNRP